MTSKEIEAKYQSELIWGNPINYKGIELHPITMENAIRFHRSVQCFLFDPLDAASFRLKGMSRLRFLMECFSMLDKEVPPEEAMYRFFSLSFVDLMQLVLQDQKFDLDDPDNPKRNGRVIHIYNDKASLVITQHEFDDFRKIILCQNAVDFSDEDIPAAMRRRYYEDQRVIARFNNHQNITFEGYIDGLSLSMGIPRKDLLTMPLREFELKSSSVISREMYLAQIQGSMNGFVKFKKEPTHWLVRKTKYEKIMSHYQDAEEVKHLTGL